MIRTIVVRGLEIFAMVEVLAINSRGHGETGNPSILVL